MVGRSWRAQRRRAGICSLLSPLFLYLASAGTIHAALTVRSAAREDPPWPASQIPGRDLQIAQISLA
jgi:hypothetical protein